MRFSNATPLMTPTTALGLFIRLSMFELRETGDWDIFLGPPERARAETGGADQWVLKRRECLGFASVNPVTSASLRYPLSVFNKNSTLKTKTHKRARKIRQSTKTHKNNNTNNYETCKHYQHTSTSLQNNFPHFKIHSQHTNTFTSKQYSYVQGPLREWPQSSQALPGFLITAQHLCTFLL